MQIFLHKKTQIVTLKFFKFSARPINSFLSSFQMPRSGGESGSDGRSERRSGGKGAEGIAAAHQADGGAPRGTQKRRLPQGSRAIRVSELTRLSATEEQ